MASLGVRVGGGALAGSYFLDVKMPGPLPVVLSAFLPLTAAVIAWWLPAARGAHRRHTGASGRVKCTGPSARHWSMDSSSVAVRIPRDPTRGVLLPAGRPSAQLALPAPAAK
jgi:hypothetical protein